MDNQFNTLLKSYHDNYTSFLTNHDENTKHAYQSAKKGIETLLANLQKEVDKKQQEQDDFKKEKSLQENADLLYTAQVRQSANLNPSSSSSSTYQWIGLGVVGFLLVGLLVY